jgi:hypothetical protein
MSYKESFKNAGIEVFASDTSDPDCPIVHRPEALDRSADWYPTPFRMVDADGSIERASELVVEWLS